MYWEVVAACVVSPQLWKVYFISKTSRAFDVLIHSSQTLLISNSVGTMRCCSLLVFPLLVSLASMLPLLLGIHLEVVTVVDYS